MLLLYFCLVMLQYLFFSPLRSVLDHLWFFCCCCCALLPFVATAPFSQQTQYVKKTGRMTTSHILSSFHCTITSCHACCCCVSVTTSVSVSPRWCVRLYTVHVNTFGFKSANTPGADACECGVRFTCLVF